VRCECYCRVESPFRGAQEDGRSGDETIADRRLFAREFWKDGSGWDGNQREMRSSLFLEEKNSFYSLLRREGERVEGLIEKVENVEKDYRKVY